MMKRIWEPKASLNIYTYINFRVGKTSALHFLYGESALNFTMGLLMNWQIKDDEETNEKQLTAALICKIYTHHNVNCRKQTSEFSLKGKEANNEYLC